MQWSTNNRGSSDFVCASSVYVVPYSRLMLARVALRRKSGKEKSRGVLQGHLPIQNEPNIAYV